jgi:hypothetical protein
MASAAQIVADRLNAQEGTRAANGLARRIPREFSPWDSRADLSNEVRGRDIGGKPIPCRRKPL